MPNVKPNRIAMTFDYMRIFVRTALGRPCSCQSKDGKACPRDDDGNLKWHTWRRYGSKNQLCDHDASCFVKRDRMCLNILDRDATQFLKEMKDSGWTIELNDPRYANMTRYDVIAMEASPEELKVLLKWIKNTVGAFSKAKK